MTSNDYQVCPKDGFWIPRCDVSGRYMPCQECLRRLSEEGRRIRDAYRDAFGVPDVVD